MECDYACLPIENWMGESVNENYDLMLRYDLTIVAEHEFRVHHCLLVKEGVKRDDVKYVISHPLALAQCANYLRGLGVTPIPAYSTAGSAKMISEGNLPEGCTLENTAAIASNLAGKTYGLCYLDVGIEDEDFIFTRFLLMGRKSVAPFLTQGVPAKTSIVFTLPDTPGALFKALTCFGLRDFDFSKIESRPTSASLLNYLKFRSQQQHNVDGRKSRNPGLPGFRYCFYLDFLASELDETAQNALANLREQAGFLRILGSYPQKSRLIGPLAQCVEELRRMAPLDPTEQRQLQNSWRDAHNLQPALKIGIIGFGPFGQYLARRMVRNHQMSSLDPTDKVSMRSNGSYKAYLFLLISYVT
jgi:prephenate dehydratase